MLTLPIEHKAVVPPAGQIQIEGQDIASAERLNADRNQQAFIEIDFRHAHELVQYRNPIRNVRHRRLLSANSSIAEARQGHSLLDRIIEIVGYFFGPRIQGGDLSLLEAQKNTSTIGVVVRTVTKKKSLWTLRVRRLLLDIEVLHGGSGDRPACRILARWDLSQLSSGSPWPSSPRFSTHRVKQLQPVLDQRRISPITLDRVKVERC